MKKIFFIALLFLTTISFAQTRTFRTKVKFIEFSEPTSNDSIVTINSNNEVGFIKKSDLLSGLGGGSVSASNGLNIDSTSSDIKLGGVVDEKTILTVTDTLNIETSFTEVVNSRFGSSTTNITGNFEINEKELKYSTTGIQDFGLSSESRTINFVINPVGSGEEEEPGLIISGTGDQGNSSFNFTEGGLFSTFTNPFSPNVANFSTRNNALRYSISTGQLNPDKDFRVTTNAISLVSRLNNITQSSIAVNDELRLSPSNNISDNSQDGYILAKKNSSSATEWIPAPTGGGGGSSPTASNGLNIDVTTSDVKLGGALNEQTTVNLNGNELWFLGDGSFPAFYRLSQSDVRLSNSQANMFTNFSDTEMNGVTYTGEFSGNVTFGNIGNSATLNLTGGSSATLGASNTVILNSTNGSGITIGFQQGGILGTYAGTGTNPGEALPFSYSLLPSNEIVFNDDNNIPNKKYVDDELTNLLATRQITKVRTTARTFIITPILGDVTIESGANAGFYYYDGSQWVKLATTP